VRLQVVSDSFDNNLRVAFLSLESTFGGLPNNREDSK